MRSARFSRVRVTASFMRSKKPGFGSVLPNRVWIMIKELWDAEINYSGGGGKPRNEGILREEE
jgi:hypothetical protein